MTRVYEVFDEEFRQVMGEKQLIEFAQYRLEESCLFDDDLEVLKEDVETSTGEQKEKFTQILNACNNNEPLKSVEVAKAVIEFDGFEIKVVEVE